MIGYRLTALPAVGSFIRSMVCRRKFIRLPVESSREVAKAVVDAGFDYGNCKKIVNDEQDEKHRAKDMHDFMVEGFTFAEKFRINGLSESEKIADIYERYKMNVIEYEIVED